MPSAASESSAPLHRALTGSKRQGQGRARPRLTVGEEGKHRRMFLFHGPCQHDDLACAPRHQHKPSLRRADAGQRLKHRAKPPDFDSQPGAMRLIGELRSECPRKEHVPRHVSGPRFAQRTRKRKQHPLSLIHI